jgi:hypothetical protein
MFYCNMSRSPANERMNLQNNHVQSYFEVCVLELSMFSKVVSHNVRGSTLTRLNMIRRRICVQYVPNSVRHIFQINYVAVPYNRPLPLFLLFCNLPTTVRKTDLR